MTEQERAGRSRREGRAERRFHSGLVNLSFVVSAAASVALTIVYARGGHPQLEGALLLLALGGIGVGLILWAHRFMPAGPYVQERKALPSPAVQRRAFAGALARGRVIDRRGFMGKLLGLALGAFGVAAILPIRSLGPSPGRAMFRTKWGRNSLVVDAEGYPVTVNALEPGGFLTVFPEGFEGSADSQTVLIRVDPRRFRPLPGREGWTPGGYLAYSKVCTHAGCPVGLYEPETHLLYCPCHQSIFDVLDGAAPTTGPAPRPLPQLPLRVDEAGFLRAQRDYDEPVGPWFWNAGD